MFLSRRNQVAAVHCVMFRVHAMMATGQSVFLIHWQRRVRPGTAPQARVTVTRLADGLGVTVSGPSPGIMMLSELSLFRAGGPRAGPVGSRRRSRRAIMA
jgi:hypothetical protein